MRIGPPRWSVDESFDLDFHLRRTRVAGPGDWADVLEFARTARHGRLRPRAGRCGSSPCSTGWPTAARALVTKLHHSLTDGIGGMQLAAPGDRPGSGRGGRSDRCRPSRAATALVRDQPDRAGPSPTTSREAADRAGRRIVRRAARRLRRRVAPPARRGAECGRDQACRSGGSSPRSTSQFSTVLGQRRTCAGSSRRSTSRSTSCTTRPRVGGRPPQRRLPRRAHRRHATLPRAPRRAAARAAGHGAGEHPRRRRRDRRQPDHADPDQDARPRSTTRPSGSGRSPTVMRRWRHEPALDHTQEIAFGLNLLPRAYIGGIFKRDRAARERRARCAAPVVWLAGAKVTGYYALRSDDRLRAQRDADVLRGRVRHRRQHRHRRDRRTRPDARLPAPTPGVSCWLTNA